MNINMRAWMRIAKRTGRNCVVLQPVGALKQSKGWFCQGNTKSKMTTSDCMMHNCSSFVRETMIRLSVAAFLISASVSAALAETVTVQGSGGVFCDDPDELKAMLLASLTKTVTPKVKTCSTISNGTKIDAIQTEKLGDSVIVGVGSFQGADGATRTGAFTFALASAEPTPKPTSAGRTYKRVGANDVRNTPTKWAGRDIEFANVNVYWVDDDDVRFVTSSSLTLFGSDIRGMPADIAFLKQNCETEGEALSRKCRVNVKFKYDSHSEDTPSGLRKRIVLRSSDIEAVRVGAKR